MLSQPSYLYPFEEFTRHCDALNAVRDPDAQPSFEANVFRVFEYMKGQFTDRDEAQWKMSRFILIMQYVAEHIQDFDKGDFAVNGSPKVGALVGRHLLRAVHELFTTTSLSELGHEPAPAAILELAATYRPTEMGQ